MIKVVRLKDKFLIHLTVTDKPVEVSEEQFVWFISIYEIPNRVLDRFKKLRLYGVKDYVWAK